MTINAKDRPSTPCPEYVEAEPDITLIRDLLAGTRRMHAQYRLYIPKYKSEKPDTYKKRATAAKVYGGLGRTLSATTGMLFANPPVKSDTWTPELEELWENIDGQGTHGDVFTKRRAEDGGADGIFAVLVDFPQVPDGVVVTAANEQALNLRPLWARYARSDILSWKTAVIDNVTTLTQVVLRESKTVATGRFTVGAIPVYRVCTLNITEDTTPGVEPLVVASWELLEEKTDGQGGVTLISHGTGTFRTKTGEAFRVIPLAVGYAGRSDDVLCARPPLLDVAWCNLEHWRVASNLRYYEDLCCFPQPTIEGQLAADENGVTPPLQIGPNVMVNVTAGSKFLWTELSGQSITALRASLEEKKNELGELGASFLAKKTRGVETAEAKRLDATAENSTLATAAQGIEDGINQALVFTAMYLGIDAEHAPTITINRDFDNLSMDAPTMLAYVSAVSNAGLPPRLLLEAWQAGGRIADDVDLDALEMEMMANSAAADAAAAAKTQDQLTMAAGGKSPDTGSVDIQYGADGKPAKLIKSRA